MLDFRKAETEEELHGILELQRRFLKGNHTKDVEAEQGFVTLKHDFDLLHQMNVADGHIIGLDGNKVIGYALTMSPKFSDKIPGLFPMFRIVDELKEKGDRNFNNYLMMGQICVDYHYRGQGVFRSLYEQFKMTYAGKYDFCLTLIYCLNTRSMAAHKHIGFTNLYTLDEAGAEPWELVIWEW